MLISRGIIGGSVWVDGKVGGDNEQGELKSKRGEGQVLPRPPWHVVRGEGGL